MRTTQHVKNHPFRFLLLIALFLGGARLTFAQTDERDPNRPVDAAERDAVIQRIAELVRERYVYADVAEKTATHLLGEHQEGAFDDLSDPVSFATALTESLQSVNHDKHMRVRLRPQQIMQRENPALAQVKQMEQARRENYGFRKVELLEGNIGYVDMRYFAGTPSARPTAAAAMNFLAHADAVIFDMRENGGGSPEMIRYISSWLFDKPTHLNSLYWREGDRTDEFWTLEDIPGQRMADTPLFVLTSGYTFSGAEEFSYNLRTQERATLVGEVTGGGANPGGVMPANERFGVFIPTGAAVNPITGDNWEGKGVTPHVLCDSEEALDKALELAREAAEEHQAAREERLASTMQRLFAQRSEAESHFEAGEIDRGTAKINAALAGALEMGLLDEVQINQMGYDYLAEDKTNLAIAVFTFNTQRFPRSFNAWDSLGEAYMNAGKNELAIRHYRMSLELNPDNENGKEMLKRLGVK